MKQALTDTQIERLRRIYGSHAKAAQALGISPRHYARIRRGEHVTPMVVSFVHKILEDDPVAQTDNG